jgi:hypothetical protein
VATMADLELAVDEVQGPSIRADLLTPRVTVEPGQPVAVSLQVLNTTDTIETIRCSLIGIVPDRLEQTPGDVTLFPGESTRITLDLWFYPTLPAGRHDIFVAVTTGSGEHATEVPLRVDVNPVAMASFVVEPPLVFAGRKGVFEARGANTGNVPLALLVRASDADRALDLEVVRPSWRMGLDGSATTRIVAKHKRPLTGPPVEHTITVTAEQDDVFETQVVRFRQKAILTPGIITIMTLAMIVAVWAFAMVFGVRAALAPPPPTKAVPETFAGGITGADLDPTTAGGTFKGMIRAATTAAGLPRVTVEAFDRDGLLVGATATDDEGSFALASLLPGRYRIRVRAEGFQDVWWPGVPSIDRAVPLLAPPGAAADGLDLELVGLPATIGGLVLLGDVTGVEVTVEVQAVDLLEPVAVRVVTAAPDGTWVVGELPSPANYRIVYRASGFDPVEIAQPVGGGATIAVNTATLPAAPGTVSGLVVDRSGRALGGVAVLLSRGELQVPTTTPTSGEVGFFEIPELRTPATYLLTFSLEGFASETIAVRLGPGEVRDDLVVVLPAAFGSLSGRLTNAVSGLALGGATVTVSGAGIVLQAETLTSGTVGGFRVAGLPVPGTYTVTFDLEGHARQTIQVSLSRAAPDVVRDVALGVSAARLEGRVSDGGTGVGNVLVRITDGGGFTLETLTATAPAGAVGDYAFDGLPRGTYTVTAIRAGAPAEVVGVITIDVASGSGFTVDAQGRPVFALDLDYAPVP